MENLQEKKQRESGSQTDLCSHTARQALEHYLKSLKNGENTTYFTGWFGDLK